MKRMIPVGYMAKHVAGQLFKTLSPHTELKTL